MVFDALNFKPRKIMIFLFSSILAYSIYGNAVDKPTLAFKEKLFSQARTEINLELERVPQSQIVKYLGLEASLYLDALKSVTSPQYQNFLSWKFARTDDHLCFNTSGYFLKGYGAPKDIFLCDLAFENVMYLKQVMVHEFIHFMGIADECYATQIELGFTYLAHGYIAELGTYAAGLNSTKCPQTVTLLKQMELDFGRTGLSEDFAINQTSLLLEKSLYLSLKEVLLDPINKPIYMTRSSYGARCAFFAKASHAEFNVSFIYNLKDISYQQSPTERGASITTHLTLEEKSKKAKIEIRCYSMGPINLKYEDLLSIGILKF